MASFWVALKFFFCAQPKVFRTPFTRLFLDRIVSGCFNVWKWVTLFSNCVVLNLARAALVSRLANYLSFRPLSTPSLTQLPSQTFLSGSATLPRIHQYELDLRLLPNKSKTIITKHCSEGCLCGIRFQLAYFPKTCLFYPFKCRLWKF